MTTKKVFLYDLDGTLVDSMPGIASSMRHTLSELKVEAPSSEEIRRAIGPGLHKALEGLLKTADPEIINKAVAIYREHHDSVGYKSTTLFPGIKEMIVEIKKIGVPQFVVSMKSDTIVRPILGYLEIEHYFEDAIGSNPEGKTSTKAEMLEFLANKYNFSKTESILVGDTYHDANAAKLIQMKFFGITFGYGTELEIRSCKWGEIFHSVPELHENLLKSV